jgi:hypothetical protein
VVVLELVTIELELPDVEVEVGAVFVEGDVIDCESGVVDIELCRRLGDGDVVVGNMVAYLVGEFMMEKTGPVSVYLQEIRLLRSSLT